MRSHSVDAKHTWQACTACTARSRIASGACQCMGCMSTPEHQLSRTFVILAGSLLGGTKARQVQGTASAGRAADTTTSGREKKPGTGDTRVTVRGHAACPISTPAPSAPPAASAASASRPAQRRQRASQGAPLALGEPSMLSVAEPPAPAFGCAPRPPRCLRRARAAGVSLAACRLHLRERVRARPGARPPLAVSACLSAADALAAGLACLHASSSLGWEAVPQTDDMSLTCL